MNAGRAFLVCYRFPNTRPACAASAAALQEKTEEIRGRPEVAAPGLLELKNSRACQDPGVQGHPLSDQSACLWPWGFQPGGPSPEGPGAGEDLPSRSLPSLCWPWATISAMDSLRASKTTGFRSNFLTEVRGLVRQSSICLLYH